jgi:hypothetical protein
MRYHAGSARTVSTRLLAARPMYLFVNRLLKTRPVRSVRTEAKRAITMARIACRLFDECRSDAMALVR